MREASKKISDAGDIFSGGDEPRGAADNGMKGLTLKKIAEVTGGELHLSCLYIDGSYRCFTDTEEGFAADEVLFSGILDKEVSAIVTDSRKVCAAEGENGPLFGAISGARVDGHDFISRVFKAGALGVISERLLDRADVFGEEENEASRNEDAAAGCSGDVSDKMTPVSVHVWIKVESTLKALGKIAAEYLQILRTPVVGITGSVGKTSTKEMIASVLSVKLRTLKTDGNFNNELGLPLTVFRLSEEDEVAVLEMGVSHFQDMTALAKIARPDKMVITNIGTCHLEYLQNREGVFRAKTEVFDYLKADGKVILNGNDDLLRGVSDVHGVRPVFFGVDSTLEGTSDLSAGPKIDYPGDLPKDQCVTVTSIRLLGFEGSECTICTPSGEFTVTVPVPGIHNCSNAAAATAVGLEYGMSLEEIKEGIESAKTIAGRFRIIRSGDRTVIDDCYNANPVSMKSSLSVLANAPGRRVAILGDMGELGENERTLHEEVGSFASGCVDLLVAVGPLSRSLYQAAARKNPDITAVWYESVKDFLEHIPEVILPGDTILVKASHYMEFGKIVEALTAGDKE